MNIPGLSQRVSWYVTESDCCIYITIYIYIYHVGLVMIALPD